MRSFRCLAALAAVGLLTLSAPQSVSQTSGAMPRLIEKDGRFALMVDGAPFLMLGAQVNNSSAWPTGMAQAWPTLEALHVNTVEAPVYWEAMEPEQGRFDFAQVDMLVAQAREHRVRLVLLWFGTWKNASGHYTPQWIKRDEAKYPHLIGEKGKKVDSLSPHDPALLALDTRAFAALMRHLKSVDAARHTVIMVQVENESGTWGAIRDHSPAAEALFQANVPDAALKAMGKQAGSWTAVFGEEAPGFFHAWSIASYIQQVAAAGKAEYSLPMYANAALRDPIHPGKQGSWESGGPTDDVFALWKAAAPAIDILAPDIYTSDYTKYMKYLDLYQFPGNALMVPETGRGVDFAHFCFAAVGHGALGWAPFGMDRADAIDFPPGARMEEIARSEFAFNFAALQPIDRLLARLNFEGKVQGSAENLADPGHTQRLSFGAWTAVVSYGMPSFGSGMAPKGNQPANGEALIAQLGPNEFLVTAYQARVEFEKADAGSSGQQREFLAVEEGTYNGETWTRSRILNGDQTDYGLNFQTLPRLLRVTLATY